MATEDERRRNAERRAALGAPSGIGINTTRNRPTTGRSAALGSPSASRAPVADRSTALGNPGGWVPTRPAARRDPGGTAPSRPRAPSGPSFSVPPISRENAERLVALGSPGQYPVRAIASMLSSPRGAGEALRNVGTTIGSGVDRVTGAVGRYAREFTSGVTGAPSQPGRGQGSRRAGGTPTQALQRLDVSPRANALRRTMPNGDVIYGAGNYFEGVGAPGNAYAPTGIDFGAANEEFARANEIRRPADEARRSRQGPSRVLDTPGASRQDMIAENNAQIQRLIADMGRGRQSGQRTAIDALTNQNRALMGLEGDIYRTDVTADTSRRNAALGVQGDLATQAAQQQAEQYELALDQYNKDREFQQSADEFRAEYGLDTRKQFTDETNMVIDNLVTQLADIDDILADPTRRGIAEDDPAYQNLSQERQNLNDILQKVQTGMSAGRPREFANGGLVSTEYAPMVEGYAMGGAIPGGGPSLGAGPDQESIETAMRQYGQYAATAAANGVHPLDAGEYVDLLMEGQSMLQQHPGMVEGYAAGGAIPVAGKQVMDDDMPGVSALPGMDMNGTDSIPAVVDGERPAALTSGEYVIPAEVVAAKGTEFFDKLVEKYLNPEG